MITRWRCLNLSGAISLWKLVKVLMKLLRFLEPRVMVEVGTLSMELAKNNISDAQTTTAVCPDTKLSFNQDQDVAPIHRASSPSFSSTRRSVSPSHEVSVNISSPEKTIHGVTNCTIPCREVPEMVTVIHRLQSLSKILYQSDQCAYT